MLEEGLEDHIVSHAKRLLCGPADRLKQSVARVGRVCVVTDAYESELASSTSSLRALVSMFCSGPAIREDDFFTHCVRCICTSSVGCIGSLLDTSALSPHEPLHAQDPTLWLFCKSVFNAPELSAQATFERLVKDQPDMLAVVGLLALAMRTPFAIRLLLQEEVEDKPPLLMLAAYQHCDPYQGRNAVHMVCDSIEGSAEMFDDRLCDAMWKCITQGHRWGGCKQHGVREMSLKMHENAVQRAARSGDGVHSYAWEKMARRCGVMIEYQRGLVHATGNWNLIWNQCFACMQMSTSVCMRKGCSAAVVVWVYTLKGMRCFARAVRPSSIDPVQWCRACATEVETQMRERLDESGLWLKKPNKQEFKECVRHTLLDDSKWKVPAVDARSLDVINTILDARSTPSRARFCAAEGGFHTLVSVACVSFRLPG